MEGEKVPEGLIRSSVILIDKPKGLTSLEMVRRVSGILGVKKAGHSGTLDPNATGLLLVTLGEARKAMPVLTGLDKEYIATMVLHGDVRKEKVKDVLWSFIGTIKQMPPVKSAVARKERERRVYELEVTEGRRRTIIFRVLCEAGTYIRKIAHDAGEALGCGAHLAELRRTKVGPFSINGAFTVEELERMTPGSFSEILMPLEEALEKVGLPRMVIKDEYEKQIRNGSPVRESFLKERASGSPVSGYVGVYSESHGIVAIARPCSGRGTVAMTERIFLKA